jgi:hypothetical protein
MAILVLTSTCSSPGVTTLSVGLSLAWPRSVLLADCDPGAHQAVLAGFLGGQSGNGKGLLRVAEAHRDGRLLRDVVIDQTIPLTAPASHNPLLLPGFATPGNANLFSGVWSDLVAAFDELGEAGLDVVVDAGRLGPGGLPAPLLERAALVCLVLRSNLRSVMSARVHAGAFLGDAQHTPRPSSIGLIVVGENEPYGKSEISKALGWPVLASVPHDAAAALHLSDGRPRPHKFDSSQLARSLHANAVSLFEQLQRTSEGSGADHE